MRRSCRTAVLAVALGLVATPALAQTPADKAVAEALFDEGKKLVDAGQVADACTKFEESQRLDAGLGTMLYLADCYERAGRTASAWATFREAAATARAAGQADREQIARARAESLEPRLHRHALKVEDVSEGLTLERVEVKTGRREPLGRGAWGVALPIDPGGYRIEANAPGKTAWSTLFEVPASAGTTTTVVPPLAGSIAPAPAPAVSAGSDPQGPLAPRAAGESSGRGDGQRLVGIVFGAAGVAGLAVGGIFTALALSSDGEADDLCGDDGPTCASSEGVKASEDAVAMGNVATAGVVVGSALLATGLVLYLTAPSDGPAAGTGFVVVRPSARGADAGMSLGGSF